MFRVDLNWTLYWIELKFELLLAKIELWFLWIEVNILPCKKERRKAPKKNIKVIFQTFSGRFIFLNGIELYFGLNWTLSNLIELNFELSRTELDGPNLTLYLCSPEHNNLSLSPFDHQIRQFHGCQTLVGQ